MPRVLFVAPVILPAIALIYVWRYWQARAIEANDGAAMQRTLGAIRALPEVTS